MGIKTERVWAPLSSRGDACRTRFPLLMVHGIGSRDWPVFNYWGRIPRALKSNGASINFGGQQSATTVAKAADELAATIDAMVEQTGCGKVNIIAHSKGGLDARWAISQLGCAGKVASLTTINTPHHGCQVARRLMERIPTTAVAVFDRGYRALFKALGDPDPSFLAGVADLTDTACRVMNDQMPNNPDVFYRSIGSRMASRQSAPFPLGLGYSMVEPMEGPNDGLVAVSSMRWGEFTLVEPSAGKGISHYDMIDMQRKNVGDFDVRKFYINLVSDLKARGF